MHKNLADSQTLKEARRLRAFFLELSDEQLHYIICMEWACWLIDPLDSVWQYIERSTPESALGKIRVDGKLSIIELVNFGTEKSLPTFGCTIESEVTHRIYSCFDDMEEKEGEHEHWSIILPSGSELRTRIEQMDIPELIYSVIHVAYIYFISYAEVSHFMEWEPYYPVPPSGVAFGPYLIKWVQEMLVRVHLHVSHNNNEKKPKKQRSV